MEDYEPNPKHDQKRSGVGRQPTNPQAAFRNSIYVKPGVKVAADTSTGEIVVFRSNTEGTIWHGYVSEYTDLPKEAQNALCKAGLVGRSGKVKA